MDNAARSGDNAFVKRSSLWLLLLLVAAMIGGAFYFDRQAAEGDRELTVYVMGGQRMAEGAEIYRRGTDAKPFTYPPFAAVPFVAFAQLPSNWYPAAWFIINFLILFTIVRWLHRYASDEETGRSPPRLWWFWLFTAVFGGRHVVSVFTNQSHDLTIAGLVALTAVSWCRPSRMSGMWAGVWAGLGAATKATPLIFVGLFGLRMHWLGLLSVLLTTVAATLLPDYLFPRVDGASWWRAWYEVILSGLQLGGTAEAAGAWNSHSVLNQSLSGVMCRMFTPVDFPDPSFVVGEQGHVLVTELSPAMAKVATLLMSGMVLLMLSACVLFATRAVRAAGGRMAAMQRTVGLGEVAAFACGMVLLSPQSSKSHFCIWLFPVAFVINYLARTRRDALAMLLFAIAMILGMLSKGMLGSAAANVLLAYGSVMWSTVFLLLATLRCLQVAAQNSFAADSCERPA